ncbi:prepilin peptidase [Paenibacillus prosopidis]|uniref:Type IV leader peptidase family protein n=1 Tax=Paenibacillus prosopidis TaxID=630520 RepID=A0A368VGS3_9BACL|nr:A24 family peptidase [Paenibacillus prosopidis]RCW40534.1 type IV leader peptidase family protein [Paenibacillus prosopidis]
MLAPALPVRFSAVLGLGLMASFMEFSEEWIVAIPFIVALLTISFCDWRHMIIPDKITIPGIILAATIRIFIHPLPYWEYVVAALLGGGIFYCFKLIGKVIRKSDAIGYGDIKLLLLTGLVLGLKLTLLSFLIFCFVGTLMGIYLVVSRSGDKNVIVPFGPVIASASFISYIYGNEIFFGVYSKLLL